MKVLGMDDVDLGEAEAFREVEELLEDGAFQIQFDCGCVAASGEGLIMACDEHDVGETGRRYGKNGRYHAYWRQSERWLKWSRRIAWVLSILAIASVPMFAYWMLSI